MMKRANALKREMNIHSIRRIRPWHTEQERSNTVNQIVKTTFAFLLRFIGVGALAGMIATFPMTVFMLVTHQLLPSWQKYALPPERITKKLVKRVSGGKRMNKAQQVGVTLLLHFGYGSNMGMLYAPIARKVQLPPALKGAIFGLLVWFGSYVGIAPVINLPDAAPKQPLQRKAMMIAAHLVWGSTLGVTENMLERVV
jgi:uncharacterized membrane protein YagU involved in acid resistance